MKKILIILSVMVLAACGEPIPQDQWKQNEVDMKSVIGFEDCTMTTFKHKTGADPIHVVRCPGASTTSQYSVSHGKNSRKRYNNTVVDDTDTTARRIDALQAELDRLKQERK